MSKGRILLLTVGACLLTNLVLGAQRGTAPDGYYPFNYGGSMFTGRLQPVSKDTQGFTPGFTLIYTKGGKSETFSGQLESKCKLTSKAGVTQSFGMEAFPEGSILTAFYMTSKNKDTHEKQNITFAISIAERNGTKIPDDKRVIVMCSEQNELKFKAFSTQ